MNTVGSAIASCLQRELLQLWATVDPTTLNVELVEKINSELAPLLSDRLLDLANRCVPHLNVDASTRLLEAPKRPVGGSLGSRAVEHLELLEELQGFLSSHDLLENNTEARSHLKKAVAAQLPMSHPWQRWLCGGCALLLPPETVLSLSATVAPVLLANKWLSTLNNDSDGEMAENAVFEKESLAQGAPQGLARALRCRRRVFALERELVARAHAEKERAAFEKAEREKSEARLMEVNHQLEERIRVRSEEVRRAGQKIIEAQRSVDECRAQLTEKKREIAQLKYQLEQSTSIRKDNEAREHEHNRAVLRSAARESNMHERAKVRVDLLQKCLKGEPVAELLKETVPDVSGTDIMLDQIEAEFGVRLRRRKEQYDTALQDFERKIEKKRQEYNEICRRIRDKKGSVYHLAVNSPPKAPQLTPSLMQEMHERHSMMLGADEED